MGDQWQLPPEVVEAFKAKDAQMQEALMKLGRIEVDYAAEKQRLVSEVQASAQARLAVVVDAAKAAGMDMEKPWRLDFATMTLLPQ